MTPACPIPGLRAIRCDLPPRVQCATCPELCPRDYEGFDSAFGNYLDAQRERVWVCWMCMGYSCHYCGHNAVEQGIGGWGEPMVRTPGMSRWTFAHASCAAMNYVAALLGESMADDFSRAEIDEAMRRA